MEHHEHQSLVRLALLLAGGGVRCRRLIAETRDVEGALAGHSEFAPLARTALELVDGEVVSLLDRVRRAGWRWSVPGDDGFPDLLCRIADPPFGLFVRGDFQQGPRVAVVGSRKATAYGLEVARLLAADLAAMGASVVSGMARGIDAAAHEAALRAGGHTAAVWGTGPDRVYPAEYGDLAERIGRSGAIATEYPPGTPPRRHHFPERNRLIAGMCDAVIVVEAAVRSGALVTARLALDEGREVLAVPGSILSAQSVGPNALIRMGARPLLTANDVAECLGITPVSERPVDDSCALIAVGESLTVDEIAARAGREVQSVMDELLKLEIEDVVEQGADARYRRKSPGRS